MSPPPAATAAATPVTATAVPEESSRIVGFDCTSALEEHAGISLREWNAGGPMGAAWNWQGGGLACTVRVRAACGGVGVVRLFAGTADAGSARLSLTKGETAPAEILVKERTWTRALSRASATEPYQTVLFTARIDATCAGEGDTPAYPWRDADAFVAGFATGE